MRSSLVLQLLLVLISVLELTRAQTTSASPLAGPCYNYSVLDNSWRATSNQLQLSYYNEVTPNVMCDTAVSWNGWYRLFIQGQSVQMPDTCVDKLSCGTHAPLWLNGTHPRIEDGVVTRNVCGHWSNNCCYFMSNPIKVKACPGNYYVYEFVSPTTCYLAYCADFRNISINNATVPPNTSLAATESTSSPSTTSASTSPLGLTTSPSTKSAPTSSPSTTLADNIIGLQMRLFSFLDLTQSGNIEIVLQQIKQELVRNGLPSSTELKLRTLQKINP